MPLAELRGWSPTSFTNRRQQNFVILLVEAEKLHEAQACIKSYMA